MIIIIPPAPPASPLSSSPTEALQGAASPSSPHIFATSRPQKILRPHTDRQTTQHTHQTFQPQKTYLPTPHAQPFRPPLTEFPASKRPALTHPTPQKKRMKTGRGRKVKMRGYRVGALKPRSARPERPARLQSGPVPLFLGSPPWLLRGARCGGQFRLDRDRRD